MTGIRLVPDAGPRVICFVEAHLDGGWVPMSATEGFFGVRPPNLLVLRRGSLDLVEATGVDAATQKVHALRERLRPEELATIMAPANQALARLSLAQPDPRELRVGEQAERHLPTGRHAVPASEVGQHHAEVVLADVREVRAAGAIAHRPDPLGRRLEPLVDPDVPILVRLDPRPLQADNERVSIPLTNQSDCGIDRLRADIRNRAALDAFTVDLRATTDEITDLFGLPRSTAAD